jgi:hypothetical protein
MLAAFGALAMLYWFPPDQFGFYPRCPFHELTGLLCPGCGATRALAAMVHGQVADAFRLNALVMALLPVLLLWGVRAHRLDDWTVPKRGVMALLAVAVAFTVIRNVV